MKYLDLEKQFHNLFINKHSTIMTGSDLISHEFPLSNPYHVLAKDFSKNNRIKNLSWGWGRIDFIIRWRNKIWAVELKYPTSSSSFLEALKILGYCAYYNWEMNTHAQPAIMIPIEMINLEHKIIAIKLNIALFAIIKQNNKFKIKWMNEPI